MAEATDAGMDVLDEVARLLDEGDIPGALAVTEQELASSRSAGAVCALAAIAFRQGNFANAIRLLEPLGDAVASSSDIPELLAVLNCLTGRITEALYYGKLATVIPPDRKLIPLFGAGLPDYSEAFLRIEHKPLLCASREALEKGRSAEALQLAEQHLQLFRDDVEGLDHYAQCLTDTGQHRSALATLRSVVTLAGPSATLFSRMGQALVALGEFDQGIACHRQAVARGAKAAVLWAAMVRDWTYSAWSNAEGLTEAVTGLSLAMVQGGPKVPRKPPQAQDKAVLTIGFLCNAPRNHGQRVMIAAVARGFDRSRVRVVGFGPGELGESANLSYRGNFDVWRNTNKVDELTLSAMIRGEEVDVLVDADGLAARERLSLLLRNSAPLQYSWLNVPLGLCLPGASGHLGTEPGLEESGMLLLQGIESGVTPLPAAMAEGTVTFGADVTLAELNPEVVRVWSAILHQVPNATLVLRDRGFSDSEASSRLVDMFGNFGVAHRIDVVSSPSDKDFFADVDVALAPYPVMRPEPYSIALSGGVPVVTAAGRDTSGFANALAALGQDGARLLAAGPESYIAIAVGLVAEFDALGEFRKAMPLRLRQAVPYSGAAFAACWERLFRERLAVLSASERPA